MDDTVIDRLGNLISLTYSWYSGKHKDVVNGQNIIVITMKIGARVIPLSIRPVSKQGRDNTSKPAIFRDMIHEVVDLFKKDGIDLTRFPITFDSWYGSKDLVDILEEVEFDQILIHAKSSYVFTIDGKKKKLSEHKEGLQFSEEAWGCKGIPVARKEAVSPTFGKTILVFFMDGSRIKCIMVFGRKLRASEAISIWKQHNGVEQFWRRLKNDLQIHKIRLRSRQGVYG
ncbi:MAG: transposase, partial [Candidatus Desantisbacteria bacterium]